LVHIVRLLLALTIFPPIGTFVKNRVIQHHRVNILKAFLSRLKIT